MCAILGVSKAYAYNLMREYNKELKAKGYAEENLGAFQEPMSVIEQEEALKLYDAGADIEDLTQKERQWNRKRQWQEKRRNHRFMNAWKSIRELSRKNREKISRERG